MDEFLTRRETMYQPTEDELVALVCAVGGWPADGALVRMTGGCHNTVYAYETPEMKLIIRHPRDETGVAALRAEYDLLVEMDGRRTPRAIGLADMGGTPVALVEFIEGVHKNCNALKPEEIEELARTLADFHAATSDYFSGNSGVKPEVAGTFGDYLRAMVNESVLDRLQAFETDGGDFSLYPGVLATFEMGLGKLDGILAAHPADFSGTKFSRLHHDLNCENIIWKPDGTVVFIDPNPTYGDPCDDVNYVISDNDGSPAFQEALLAAYGRAAPGAAISPVRMEAYTLKNWLDDLAWTIEMCEKYKHDETLYEKYKAAYDVRLAALQELIGS